MTQEEVIDSATRFVREQGITVVGIDAVLKIPADKWRSPRKGGGDMWAVRFFEPTIPGIKFCPSITVVLVDDTTGEVAFKVGM